MTTHELAKALLDGPDLPCTVSGYEGGVTCIDYIAPPTPIHLNVHSEWYYGEHEYHEGLCMEDNADGTHTIPETLAIHLK